MDFSAVAVAGTPGIVIAAAEDTTATPGFPGGGVILQGGTGNKGGGIGLFGGNANGTNQDGGGIALFGGVPTGSGNGGMIQLCCGFSGTYSLFIPVTYGSHQINFPDADGVFLLDTTFGDIFSSTLNTALSKGFGIQGFESTPNYFLSSIPYGGYDLVTDISFSPVVIPTETWLHQYSRLKIRNDSGTPLRMAFQGTSRLILDDFDDNAEDTFGLRDRGSCVVGTPKRPSLSFTLPDNYFHDFLTRLELFGTVRANLKGNSDLYITDDFKTRNRIVLAGRGT
jgi:hypothetical protein